MESLQRDFLDIIKEKYTLIHGRARRREYWMFQLWSCLLILGVYLVTVLLSLISPTLGFLVLALGCLACLALVIPSVCLGIRRLHDIGQSGLMLLLYLVPGIGSIIVLVMFLIDSQPEDNRYGPNPKANQF
jgi:uncharacterized membrane protein YhaH (DUF805 family)